MSVTGNESKRPQQEAAEAPLSADEKSLPERTYGRNVRLEFDCPHCQQACRVRWEDLCRGFQCPQCRRNFAINGRGDLEAFRQVRFECPRCKHVGVMQSVAGIRTTQCTACHVPLFTGPKKELYDADGLAQAKRHAREVAAEMRSAAKENRVRLGPLLCIGVVGILLAAGIGFWIASFWGAKAASLEFTQRCLSGNWDNLPSFVISETGQRAALNRWLQAEIVPVQDEHRPRGDSAELSTEVLSDENDAHVLQIEITSPYLGRRRHKQVWRRDQQSEWKFDASATLRLP